MLIKKVIDKNKSNKRLIEKRVEKQPANSSNKTTQPNKPQNNKLKEKFKLVLVSFSLVLIFAMAIMIAVSFGINTKNKNQVYSYAYSNYSKAQQYSKYLGTIERTKPEVKDGGLSRYPEFGVGLKRLQKPNTDGKKEEDYLETLDEFITLRKNILAENASLISTTSHRLDYECDLYDEMDAHGNLYLKGEPVMENGEQKYLYKHTASKNMYFGNVADDEPAIIKQITINPRSTGDNYITGLYAPAGEVIKLEISQEDLDACGGFYIYTGQIISNGQANNIWIEGDNPASREFNRMPIIANKLPAKKTTVYFGSYFGGPIYIGHVGKKAQFTVTISGAVRYSHFILGCTSKEEFEFNSASSAPYFDLEVWDDAVRFSGPKKIAEKYDYDELYNCAIYWDKISRVSNMIPSGSAADIGIVFLFEPFVAAGAAVAFVGRNTVNCPVDWFDGVLNYEAFKTNGNWGNIHEFNHHYQNFGFPGGTEVTNNVVNLIEYSLFTKVSSSRNLEGMTSGDTWWGAMTDAGLALKETLNNTGTDGRPALSYYTNILHAFGQDMFIKAIQASGGSGTERFYNGLCNTLHYDFAYYIENLCSETYTISEAAKEAVQAMNYPVFVPVASSYQTGRSYIYNNEKYYSNTEQPFVIDGSAPYEFDLLASIYKPAGFSVKIKNVTNPKFGQLEDLQNGKYRYTFDKNSDYSGEMYATLEITNDNHTFEVLDVDLVINFERKTTSAPTLTKYKFESVNDFNSVDDALNNLSNATKTVSSLNSMLFGSMEANSLVVIEGKFKMQYGGTYRFSFPGRNYLKAELSLDGKNYQLGANMVDDAIKTYEEAAEKGYYIDLTFKNGQWIYYRMYLLGKVGTIKGNLYVAMGYGKVENGVVSSYSTSFPTLYSQDSVIKEFNPDYFYKREYKVNEIAFETKQTVVETNFTPWDGGYIIDYAFDNNTNTVMHSINTFSETNPFEMTVDLGKEIVANKLTIIGRGDRTHTPIDFDLFVGNSADNLRLVGNYKNVSLINDKDVIVNFDKQQLRYYKLVVTKTSHSNDYICIAEISLNLDFDSGKLLSPDDKSITYRGNWDIYFNSGTFGHTYISKNGTIEFEFVGCQFAINSFGNTPIFFSVSIDDGKFNTVATIGNKQLQFYLSDVLKEGKHKVKIKSTTLLNFDSVLIR